MNYPYREKQTLIQYLLNTFDWRMWHRNPECECCWEYLAPNLWPDSEKYKPKLMFIITGGCPYHD
jgi:hypothetical protein